MDLHEPINRSVLDTNAPFCPRLRTTSSPINADSTFTRDVTSFAVWTYITTLHWGQVLQSYIALLRPPDAATDGRIEREKNRAFAISDVSRLRFPKNHINY